jgi:hypothetical protein
MIHHRSGVEGINKTTNGLNMTRGKTEYTFGTVVGRFVDCKIDDSSGDIVSITVEVDMIAPGRDSSGALALASKGISEEPYKDRTQGFEVSPTSEPNTHEFEDVYAQLATDDAVCELYYQHEVVATATRQQLEEIAESETREIGENKKIKRRLRDLEEQVRHNTSRLDDVEETDHEDESVNTANSDSPNFVEVIQDLL